MYHAELGVTRALNNISADLAAEGSNSRLIDELGGYYGI